MQSASTTIGCRAHPFPKPRPTQRHQAFTTYASTASRGDGQRTRRLDPASKSSEGRGSSGELSRRRGSGLVDVWKVRSRRPGTLIGRDAKSTLKQSDLGEADRMTSGSLSDSDLVERARAGDAEAFEAIVEAHP